MTDLPDRFLHGSMTAFEPGFTLTPRGKAYEADWVETGFYAALEGGRPEGMRPHRDAVFLAGTVEDVELSGGGTEWCLEVEPTGPVTRHDVNWSNAVASLVDAGHPPDSSEVRQAVSSYWAGTPHHDENVWEYLAPSARVIRCEPFEDFDADAGGPGARI